MNLVHRREIARISKRLLLWMCVLTAACVDDLEGTEVPASAFYFPIGLEVSDDGRFAYVVNSNFDLRFNSGWLSVVSLEAVQDGDVVKTSNQQIDAITQRLLVPSLGGEIARMDASRFFVGHRSDRLISVIDVSVDGSDLGCGDASAVDGLTVDEQRTDCDRAHLIELSAEAAASASGFDGVLSEEDVADPFSLLVANPNGQEFSSLLVGQLSQTRLNAMEVGAELPFLRFGDGAGRSESLLGPGRFNTLVLVPGQEGKFAAAAGFLGGSPSSGVATIVHLDLERFLLGENDFFAPFEVGFETRAQEIVSLVFNPEGTTAYGVARVTNLGGDITARGSVLRFDTTLERRDLLDGRGDRTSVVRPKYALEGQTALRGLPSDAVYLERPEGDLLAVTDLNADVVYVLDPTGVELPLLARIDVPGGPFAVRAATIAGRPSLVVTLFSGHGLAILDVAGEPSRFRLSATLRSTFEEEDQDEDER